VPPKLYKAGEVCEAAGLQPYVLRSWEKEFPGIGVQRSPDSPRLYRQSDLDHVLRIKQLVFGEGLTLAGARRRLEESLPEADDDAVAEVMETLGADARARIAMVRRGLRSLLEVLSNVPGAAGPVAVPPLVGGGVARTPSVGARTAKVVAKRDTVVKHVAGARRKRASA
jgi:DNA-binding transcriptional MerR regulator